MNRPAPPPARPATYQDVLDAPPHLVAEIVGSRLSLHPRPAPRHINAASVLGRRIGTPYDDGLGGPGGWRILIEPELHLGPDVLVPDLAGWRRERMPSLPPAAWFDLAPDWVCEVLSPSTRRLDRTGKKDAYAAAGVAHLWLVDPDARELDAFALRGGAWAWTATLAGEDEVRVAPFDAVAFPLAALWS